MKIIIAFLVLCVVGSTYGQSHIETGQINPTPQEPPQGWYEQESHTTTSTPSIFFIDKDTGWAGTDVGCFGATDGGDTWVLYSPIILGAPHFIDSRNGIAFSDTSLVRTFDGGHTWTPTGIAPPIRGRLQAFGLDTVYLYNNNTEDFAGTTDGGKSWYTSNTGAIQQGAIHFATSKIGFVGGEILVWFGDPPPPKGTRGASFMYTTDGGVTWHARFPLILGSFTEGINSDLHSIFAVDPQNIYAAGDTEIFSSSNGGISWKSLLHGFYVSINGFHFFDTTRGYAVGNGGYIYFTEDAGKTWETQNSTVSNHLESVIFTDTLQGWACGHEGVILHTMNGGKSWVRQYLPFDSIVVQTFPEPAQSFTNLHYTIPSPQHVTLTVYDPTGRTVLSPIVNEFQPQGEHKIPIDVSSLANGAYYVRFQTERYQSTVRITVVR